VCDTVGILSAGKMIACGPVQQILGTVRQNRLIQVETLGGGAPRARELLRRAPGAWEPLPEAQTNGTLRYQVDADETQLSQALALLLQGGVSVVSFAEVPVDLEDAFMILTQ
jgi:ABC-type multidrug transport system ATPase subunit